MFYCRQEAIKRQGGLDEFQQNKYFHQVQNRSETDSMNRHCNWNLEWGHPSPQSGWLTPGNASRTSNPFLLPLCHWRQRMDGWFSLLSWLPAPNPPFPPPLFTVPSFSVWKEAWCPLESPSQAKETFISPGNLGPSQSPAPKANLAWIGSFADTNAQIEWSKGHWWGSIECN